PLRHHWKRNSRLPSASLSFFPCTACWQVFSILQTVAAARRLTLPNASARPIPARANAPVASQVDCQPPVRFTTHATTGGPTNWPSEEHCCSHPTVVVVVCALGATAMACTNRVAGISPPTAESVTTAAYCTPAGS